MHTITYTGTWLQHAHTCTGTRLHSWCNLIIHDCSMHRHTPVYRLVHACISLAHTRITSPQTHNLIRGHPGPSRASFTIIYIPTGRHHFTLRRRWHWNHIKNRVQILQRYQTTGPNEKMHAWHNIYTAIHTVSLLLTVTEWRGAPPRGDIIPNFPPVQCTVLTDISW